MRRAAAALLTACLAGTIAQGATVRWPEVSREELAMTSEPKVPGAPAIYLYREVNIDDRAGTHDYYNRVKILTQAGLGQAAVRIVKGERVSVESVQGRTIHADGTVVEFDGKVFNAPDGDRRTSTTFTLPAVDVGSVLEYRYRLRVASGWVADSFWPLSEALFTKAARFSLVPDPYMTMALNAPAGLPPGVGHPTEVKKQLVLEAHDLPAFVKEDFAPPDRQLRYRLEVVYTNPAARGSHADTDPTVFWNEYAKQMQQQLTKFIGEPGVLKNSLAQVVAAGDSPEIRLRKIYSRVQQLRHFPRGSLMTQEEIQEETAHPILSAVDVWKQGRGTYEQLTWLFLGLVRAAGLQADLVSSPRRDEQFFEPRLMDARALLGYVAAVTLDGRVLYLEPGTRNQPFGLLPWVETGVRALKVGQGGGEWVTLPLPSPQDSRIDRQATLQYSGTGLEGTVEVRYTGYEASWRRWREMYEDALARRAFLESDLSSALPVTSVVKLLNDPDWTTADAPLMARFSISIPGWVQSAGSRTLLPTGLFSAATQNMFTSARRTNPLYFWWPYVVHDDVHVQLPSGWRVRGLPENSLFDFKAFRFETSMQDQGGSPHWTRELTFNAMVLPASAYGDVKDFFDSVRSADEQPIVIAAAATPAR
jgi:hypothetical protein